MRNTKLYVQFSKSLGNKQNSYVVKYTNKRKIRREGIIFLFIVQVAARAT